MKKELRHWIRPITQLFPELNFEQICSKPVESLMLGVASSQFYPFRTFIPDWALRDPENHPESVQYRLRPPTLVPKTLHRSPWVRKSGFR